MIATPAPHRQGERAHLLRQHHGHGLHAPTGEKATRCRSAPRVPGRGSQQRLPRPGRWFTRAAAGPRSGTVPMRCRRVAVRQCWRRPSWPGSHLRPVLGSCFEPSSTASATPKARRCPDSNALLDGASCLLRVASAGRVRPSGGCRSGCPRRAQYGVDAGEGGGQDPDQRSGERDGCGLALGEGVAVDDRRAREQSADAPIWPVRIAFSRNWAASGLTVPPARGAVRSRRGVPSRPRPWCSRADTAGRQGDRGDGQDQVGEGVLGHARAGRGHGLHVGAAFEAGQDCGPVVAPGGATRGLRSGWQFDHGIPRPRGIVPSSATSPSEVGRAEGPAVGGWWDAEGGSHVRAQGVGGAEAGPVSDEVDR